MYLFWKVQWKNYIFFDRHFWLFFKFGNNWFIFYILSLPITTHQSSVHYGWPKMNHFDFDKKSNTLKLQMLVVVLNVQQNDFAQIVKNAVLLQRHWILGIHVKLLWTLFFDCGLSVFVGEEHLIKMDHCGTKYVENHTIV